MKRRARDRTRDAKQVSFDATLREKGGFRR